MSVATFFSSVESDISSAWDKIKGSPAIQNLESAAESFFSSIIGAMPWNQLKTYVSTLATSELSTLEAHNKLLALAATFVPGGNASIATMVASGAVNTVAGLLAAVPVPTAATAAPATAQ